MSDLSKFLKKTFSAAQLKDQAPIVLTIMKVEALEMGEDRDVKPTVTFAQDPRKLVLNVNKYDTLSAAHGTRDVNAWVGATVALSFDPSVKFGNNVGGVKLEIVQRAPALATA